MPTADRDPLLERLGSRFEPPPDPLGGVIKRRHRRTRNRRIAGGAVGAVVGIGVIAVLLRAGAPSGEVPTVSPGRGSTTLGTMGLHITIPPSFTTIDSVQAYQRYVTHNGAWGELGNPNCWGPLANLASSFVGGAYLDDNPAPSEPSRRLLVLRTSDRSEEQVIGCETNVREAQGGRLIQRTDVKVDGVPGVRLVFRGGTYTPGRVNLLYVVDDGAFRWAFDFTMRGAQPGALHQFDSIMLLSVRFP
jgi:hypothetical protein